MLLYPVIKDKWLSLFYVLSDYYSSFIYSKIPKNKADIYFLVHYIYAMKI